MSDTPPKSAVELTLEKLKRQDAQAGVETIPLTETQAEAIAEVRRNYEAQTAECHILHQSALAGTFEPEARQEVEANFRRDLARFANDRDKKIDRIRSSPAD